LLGKARDALHDHILLVMVQDDDQYLRHGYL
jgi:hypothetical protein